MAATKKVKYVPDSDTLREFADIIKLLTNFPLTDALVEQAIARMPAKEEMPSKEE